MLDSPSDFFNYATFGFTGMVQGAVNPKDPLSKKHWLDSFGVATSVLGVKGASSTKTTGVTSGKSTSSLSSNNSKGTGKNISHPVLDNTRSGSALKKPDGQHGFNDIIDNYTPHSKEFEIVGGDGVKRKLYQIEGGMKYYDYKDVYNRDLRINERITTVKDQNGIFEWIVDPTKGVTHRRFIPNGQITGSSNQRP
ncbi:hemolysin [Lysinibacillus capsici]|uniref:hemolysin n=1 Tax=Lysinibacillus capsici TaxID=2115968 RepID=UPI0028BE6E6E|nr:hemolysin [Lysinibacillus capsici]WNN74778.1 hemolysin [Lysinibacillus capsici]